MKKSILIVIGVVLTIVGVGLTGFKSKEKGLKKNTHVSETTKKTKDSITWYSMTDGYALAKKKNKILVVDVYTDWCYYCKVMDKQTYEDSSVINKMNAYCIAVKFNPEVNGNHVVNGETMTSSQLLSYLNKGGRNPGYPMTFLWKSLKDQTKIAPYSGYLEKSLFHDILNKTIQQ